MNPGPAWFNGRSSDENLADAKSFFFDWVRLTTTMGQGEFDSPTYIIVFLGPLVTLATFAEDPEIRGLAETMLSWVLADYAVENLDGLYAGGHSRDYSYDAIKPESAPNVGWGWLFFGSSREVLRSDNITSVWTDYRMPFVINNIANDRSEPYVHKERKRVRNVMRFGKRHLERPSWYIERNPPVYKTTYMTKDHALGSLQGGILQPIQQHTWDITLGHKMANPTIFSLHPFYDAIELAMFFPEEVEWLTDQVDRYHLVYTDPDKWNSSSPYERTLQHKNAIIVLYDIADDAHHGHVDAFFPASLDTLVEDESGWIVAQAGGTLVGVRPLQKYEWSETEGGWRLRSPYRQNGFIVEVVGPDEFSSLGPVR